MAIAEACQLWIEQRIEEELQDKSETGKSLREIGRELAAEIERVFKARVSPNTLRMKASRMVGGTNVPDSETPATTPVEGGNTGNKLTPKEVVVRVDALVKKGKSVREATKEVAWEMAQNPGRVLTNLNDSAIANR